MQDTPLYRFTHENVMIYGDTLHVLLDDGSDQYSERYINKWALCDWAGGRNGFIKNGLDQWIPFPQFIEENHGDYLDWLCAEYINQKEGRTMHRPTNAIPSTPYLPLSLSHPLTQINAA
jgi:hypothetical protein